MAELGLYNLTAGANALDASQKANIMFEASNMSPKVSIFDKQKSIRNPARRGNSYTKRKELFVIIQSYIYQREKKPTIVQ